MLELLQIGQVVGGGEPPFAHPMQRVAQAALRQPQSCPARRDWAHIGREVPVVEAFGLVEQLKRAVQIALCLPDARQSRSPTIGVLRQRGQFTQGSACEQMLFRGVKVVVLVEQGRQADVHVGSALPDPALRECRPLQTALEGGPGIAQAAQRDLDIRQRDRAADRGRDVAGEPQVRQALDHHLQRRHKIAGGPRRHAQLRGRPAPCESILLDGAVARLAGVGHGRCDVTERQGLPRPDQRHPARQAPELSFIDDDHVNGPAPVGAQGEPALGIAQPPLHARHLAAGHARQSVAGAEHRPGAHQIVGQLFEPAKQHCELASQADGRQHQLDQVSGVGQIAGSQGMPDRGGKIVAALVPGARPPVQNRDSFWLALMQMRPQDVGEEMVIAIPLPGVIEGDDEQVAALQEAQPVLCIVAAGDGIAQRSAQPVEDAGLQQKVADAVWQSSDDFVDQIVEDEAMTAGEGFDEGRGVITALHRERGELQARDPALGAGFEGRHLALGQGQAHDVAQKLGGFGRREAQVGGAQFDQLVAGAQPGQRQRRILARGDDQVQARWLMLEQKGDGAIHGSRVDPVIVVENEDERAIDRSEFVGQGRQSGLSRAGLQVFQRGRHAPTEGRVQRLQG